MALNVDYLRALRIADQDSVITDAQAMFYALSIGLGRDPMDSRDLHYVYERDLQIFPTMPLVIGHPGSGWQNDPATGITRAMVVHGSQRLTTFAPLPVGGTVTTSNRITEIVDKGGKGAIITLVRETMDKATGALLARGESGVFCRADGGFGGAPEGGHDFVPIPDRTPDSRVEIATEPNMALIYRLNHDRNPIHSDPEAAAKAGFPRPILHGLATFGIAAVAMAKAAPERTLRSIEARFSRPVFPGETVTVEQWEDADGIAFRARIDARQVTVLDMGRASFA